MAALLLFSIFIVSTCGLIYELIAGTLASYLLGDSVTQFSIIIGVYLFSMGIGSFLSKYIDKKLIETFIHIEMIIGMVGGFSTLSLYIAFQQVEHFKPLLYTMVFLIGSGVGLEIPLMMRILKSQYQDFKELVSHVFTFDYVGALIASLLFPLVLVPYLGLIKSAFLFGILNVSIGALAIRVFNDKLQHHRLWYAKVAVCMASLLLGCLFSNKLTTFAESLAYDGKIILSQSTPYQRIIISRLGNEFRLYLNGNLQFNSQDEYRYHEALVHVGLSQIREPKKVLILGGGDGLAAREILKYPSVEKITLVDLDPAMTKLFRAIPMLTKLNDNSLSSPKLKIINQDAFLWLKNNKEKFDFVVIDFPDPANYSLGKLYTKTFYQYLYMALSERALVAVQSTAPYIARKSYWCVANTLEQSGFFVKSYVTYVPAFGLWGFHLAAKDDRHSQEYRLPVNLRYITTSMIPSLFILPQDISKVDTEVNVLTNQALVRYFEEEWQHYNG